MNFSASIGNLNTSSKSSSSGTYGSYSDDDSYSLFYIQLGVIPAYFFTDGLAFEPEINVLFQSQENVESKPSFSFLGNFAYNFNMPGKNFAPYVRAGYGISNSMQIPAVIGGLARVSDDLNVNILNAGVGLKFLVSPHLLLRTEINYRRYSYKVENSYPDFNSTYDYSLTSISGIFGFSVLL
ncbi:MAG: hypothetical protein A2058_05370 [Ignavibacteria bacterium GWA2_36_19]|nr:MAG: hypothetical protein A2058_05370 [Ignavibacteria bacterium GWA2_36_19]